MKRIELRINNQIVDFGDDVKVTIDKIVSEYRDPLKATGTLSLSMVLPLTNTNRTIFFHEDDKQVYGKFRRMYPAQLLVNGQVIIDGTFKTLDVSPKGFKGGIGATRVSNPTLGDLLGKKKLTELQSMTKLDFSGASSVTDSWNSVVAYPDAEVCYPFVLTSFPSLNPVNGFQTTYEDLGISHFAAAVLRAIFIAAGYTVEGEIFDNGTFQKLTLLYSNAGPQQWNYGKLAPFQATFNTIRDYRVTSEKYPGFYVDNTSSPNYKADALHIFETGIQHPNTGAKNITGDLAQLVGIDGAVFCKYSGVYDVNLDVHTRLQYRSNDDNALNTITHKVFHLLRDITDVEYLEPKHFNGYATFETTPVATLPGVVAVGNGNHTVRLEAGKLYRVQSYIGAYWNVPDRDEAQVSFTQTSTFGITACNGPLLVNPATFLPDMAQTEFVAAMFKMFNLYYQVNESEKVVTLLTRDEFFQESLQDIVDMSPYIDLDSMTETPLNEKDVESTYIQWATDEADHILRFTDYLELVNGELPDGATQIPFAPLGFVQYDFPTGTLGNVGHHYDMLPAILPALESEDLSQLDDTSKVTESGSWVPRLVLYHGNDWIKPSVFYFVNVLGSGTHYPPKLTFFDVASQPFYEVTQNTQLRSFAVTRSTNPTIYANGGDDAILADVDNIPALDKISLATSIDSDVNPKGFFYSLYLNDLLINSLSNYLEGAGRMNPVLFSRLTGRQVLRIDNDLFLLESLKAYDVSSDFATYKVYRLVANNRTDFDDNLRFTSTQTYTATCPSPATGDSVTRTATKISFVSQAQADASALAEAQRQAEYALVCTVPTWTATSTFTARCEAPMYGPAVTRTVTYTSRISQQDADDQAALQAENEATTALVCRNPGSGPIDNEPVND